MSTLRKIMVSTDFGPSSAKAVELAIDLALASDASLILFHAVEYPNYGYAIEAPFDLLSTVEQAARDMLAKELERVRTKVPGARSELAIGQVADCVLSAIERDAPDLLVLGTHGRKGLNRFLLGSVAERLVRTSPIPVLTVRATEKA